MIFLELSAALSRLHSYSDNEIGANSLRFKCMTNWIILLIFFICYKKCKYLWVSSDWTINKVDCQAFWHTLLSTVSRWKQVFRLKSNYNLHIMRRKIIIIMIHPFLVLMQKACLEYFMNFKFEIESFRLISPGIYIDFYIDILILELLNTILNFFFLLWNNWEKHKKNEKRE